MPKIAPKNKHVTNERKRKQMWKGWGTIVDKPFQQPPSPQS
jgi:hypothetical protein